MSTARDMLDMLRRHYLPEGRQPGGIFAPEIQAPASTRRADLIWQSVTAAGGNGLIGHEVKVTRADVLNELADPAKSDPWQRYCDRWWLVVAHPSLVEGLDLPPSWGVMAPPSGRRTRSMTVVLQAPQLKPADQAPAFATVAKWLHWRHYDQVTKVASLEKEAERLRRLNDDLRTRSPFQSPHKTRTEEAVRQILVGLGGVQPGGRVGDWQHEVTVEDVIAALRDLGSVYSQAQSMRYQFRRVQQALKDLTAPIDARSVAEFDAAVAKFGERERIEVA